MRRYLAGQFARPRGIVGRLLIGPWLDRIAGPGNRLAMRMLDVQPGEHVLEIGFGGGDLLAALLKEGGKATGVDPSEAMHTRARRRFRRALREGRLSLIRNSVEQLALERASIDAAVSVASLYFWPGPEAAFAGLARVIRPGGRLVLCFEPAEDLRKWPGHRFGFRLYDEAELRELLTGAGFETRSVQIGHGRKPDRFLCLSAVRGDANG